MNAFRYDSMVAFARVPARRARARVVVDERLARTVGVPRAVGVQPPPKNAHARRRLQTAPRASDGATDAWSARESTQSKRSIAHARSHTMALTAIGAALADVKTHVAASEQRIGANAKASVLFTTRQAADIDLESIHAIGVSGFEELCRRDGRFEAHAKGLFSTRAAEGARREARDAESNAATSKLVRAYLRLLSGYFTERAASKTIEYLIRRFKIHVYDVDDLIACAMPWHGTAEFVKVAQTCQLENSKHFKWLSGVKETGAAPPRDALAVRCSKDKAFFTFCAQSAAEMATTKVRRRMRMMKARDARLAFLVVPLWLKRPITPSHALVYSNRDGLSTGVVYLIA